MFILFILSNNFFSFLFILEVISSIIFYKFIFLFQFNNKKNLNLTPVINLIFYYY